jgi:hypothetical protein
MSMNTTGLGLLIPEKSDPERDAVAEAFAKAGGTVHRIGRFWDPPKLDPATTRVYGPDSFCLVLQQKLGLALHSPDDDLLLRVPGKFLNRRITTSTLGDASEMSYPVFVKPITPKQFRASIFAAVSELQAECRGLPHETRILVSEVVAFKAEVRAFVLNGRLLDAAVYEGAGDVADAERFVLAVASELGLPAAVVVDIGFIERRGWALIEFNAAWGAGLNGCDAQKALPAIVAASGSEES